MRIVNRKTFLSLPAGRVFAKYEPCVADHFAVKGNNCGDNDFFYTSLDGISAVDANSSEDTFDTLFAAQGTGDGQIGIPITFDVESRDGCFDEGQLFLVLDADDVWALIERLKECL